VGGQDQRHASFDGGYEKLRETIFANQKKLGVIPKDAKLTPWPNEMLKPWDQLSAEEKKLFIRQVEVFAAYAAYSDHEIGRVIQAFQDLGKLDNTLIIYINGDNGTSAEGGPMGTPNEVAFFNGLNEMPVDVQMKWYDVWGTEQTYNHMSAGWSWAFDTPFDWFKQNASRLGGINQNMVVSWPARIKDKGALREQFVHVIDVVPTILEAAGIKAPEMVDGIKQAPIEGTSFPTPSTRPMPRRVAAQDAVLRDDGPVGALRRRLATQHQGQPRAVAGLSAQANTDPLNNQVFQLYNLGKDFNQTEDIAAQQPAEGQGDAPEVPRRGEEVPGLAAGCVGGGPYRRATPEHHRRADGIRLHATDGRFAAGRLAVPAELVLHDHRRHHRAAGRRRGHDPDLGRTLRGLWLLPAQGQAGVPVEPGRPQAHQVGRPRGAHARASTRWSSTSSMTASASGRWRSTT
jgi:arylsulfatase A-like enzyme